MARPRKGVTFWDRVYSHVIELNGCQVFTGSKDSCGYGRINRDGRLVRIHRAVWEKNNGEIPSGLVVCHSCDVRACINPEHLFIGTQAENIRDMDKKGRRKILVGSQQGSSKLREQDIPNIRSRLNSGDSCELICKDYGVSPGLIRHIKKDRIWRHISEI